MSAEQNKIIDSVLKNSMASTMKCNQKTPLRGARPRRGRTRDITKKG